MGIYIFDLGLFLKMFLYLFVFIFLRPPKYCSVSLEALFKFLTELTKVQECGSIQILWLWDYPRPPNCAWGISRASSTDVCKPCVARDGSQVSNRPSISLNPCPTSLGTRVFQHPILFYVNGCHQMYNLKENAR